MAAETSNRFGDYFVDALIGEGGMGKVYRARQVKLDRWVALKVLPRARENKTFVERFYREARSAAKLVHPNIIQIYTVEDLDGIPFYAMEYIEGDDLEHLLNPKNPPYTHDETMETIRSVAKALTLANEHGIVHRDIKPANIMITKSGLVKVMDFGLAKGIDNSMTQAGLIVGTPSYMSPEQGAGKVVDCRSDIYSLGCVFYECLARQAPYEAENIAVLIYKHMYENPTPPTELQPDCNPEMEKVCLKMMAKNPADRYQNARELLEALSKIPANSSAADISLSKRAESAVSKRKEHPSGMNKTVITPEGFLGVSPKAESGQNLVALVDADAPAESAGPLPAPVPAASPNTAAAAHASPGPFHNIGLHPTTALQDPGAFVGSPAAVPTPAPPPAPAPPAAPVSVAAVSPLPPAPPSVTPPPPPRRAFQATRPVPVPPVQKDPISGLTARPSALTRPNGSTPMPGAQAAPAVAMPSTVLFNNSPSGVSGRLLRPADSAIFKSPPRMDLFSRLPDGRWSYKMELGRCTSAEGLAADLPVMSGGKPVGLGDCLLCSNWNKRTGCALALCLEMERQNRFRGLKLLSEQALVWSGAGRFDRAVALLDNYIKNFPDDAEGYRELARVYDRPDYRGKDKRRMIVLYQRFAELARTAGNYTPLEITRAEERAVALSAMPPDTRSGFHSSNEGIAFQCFHRHALVMFAYGVLTNERLVIARAGEVDPESGIVAADMGGAMGRATTIFRRFKSEQAKKDEQAAVKRELTRLSDLSLDALASDPAKIQVLTYEQMNSAELNIDTAVHIYTVTIKTPGGSHQLLFSESASFKAEQVCEMVRRHLGKLGKKSTS